MKTLLALLCCIFSISSFAADSYTPPTTLNTTQARTAHASLVKSKLIIQNHWQQRLAMAKQRSKLLAKSGAGLQRPYYGDHLQTK